VISIVEKAYAKINFFLDILHKRDDGYHEIRTILQTISLYDEISFCENPSDINLICDGLHIPTEKNLVYKTILKIRKETGCKKGVNVKLIKKIPSGAGLGGGSSDAASTIKGLNKLWHLGLCYEEMSEIGKNIGSDVPFFIKGGTALAEGRGEILKSFLPTPELFVVVVKPEISISTPWAYGQWKYNSKEFSDFEGFIKSFNENSFINKNMLFNSFESIVVNYYPEIGHIKERFKELGISDNLLSGSGSSVFGLTGNPEIAEKAKSYFQSEKMECFATRTVKRLDE